MVAFSVQLEVSEWYVDGWDCSIETKEPFDSLGTSSNPIIIEEETFLDGGMTTRETHKLVIQTHMAMFDKSFVVSLVVMICCFSL
jgi:hypothetical protein